MGVLYTCEEKEESSTPGVTDQVEESTDETKSVSPPPPATTANRGHVYIHTYVN